ncbi:hypothetical protein HBI62_201760 [Parastagonospora nodorum]|nr:hypothetical protein HBI62_201760 [Parastagonospora nodorum]KAH5302537.1 hypothetical protein HBI12_184110 [Parastagonospora nodorum]KAH5365339.1 hypothetical protein HBI33_184520 [Parastagonospora nodorum]KAH5463922.1 hypothetical protein HBI31_209020 [Parastagonospora nodorum]KAH6142043.1 hypothetical protein HBI63_194420 [Parastagonospora nodorum]
MSALGKVRIGHKAPDFHCEAVMKGVIEEVSLSTYIRPSIKPGEPNHDAPWLIILFIPAAFSFVCPTEVLAFQNCLDEFKDRNCSVIFISVDTKHALWHWQNVPRQYGGLGMIDISLLSDATHRISQDYGVLIEDEGISLRGMFIIDGEGIVQQITLNALTVGRSVLESLRLLEAFQAVAKHGVLCPIDWKPSGDAADTLNTISNTLTESYDERLANLQKEFGSVQVTDLDAKQKSGGSIDGDSQANESYPEETMPKSSTERVRSDSRSQRPIIQEVKCERGQQIRPPNSHTGSDCLPHPPSPPPKPTHADNSSAQPTSAPHCRSMTPVGTSSTQPTANRRSGARHTRGHSTAPPCLLRAQSSNSVVQQRLASRNTANTYESRRGSQVVLEFADPTAASPKGSPQPALFPKAPALTRAASWQCSTAANGDGWKSPGTPGQTRLQQTFDTIKKISAGLASPRLDYGRDWGSRSGSGSNAGDAKSYFDVVVEGNEGES